MSQKKPPIRNKKLKAEVNERPLSIDARSDEDKLSEKFATPEAEWKHILVKIQKKNDWESQFKACNIIKDFSESHPQFFKPTDSHFSEIMNELYNL